MTLLVYVTFFKFIIASVYSILSIHRDALLYIRVTKVAIIVAIILLFFQGCFLYKTIAHAYKINIFTFFYLIVVFLSLLLLFMSISRWKDDFRALSAIITPLITVIYGISLLFYGSNRFMAIEPNHNLMLIHIVLSLLGEVLFFIAFASAVLYLVVSWQLQKKSSMKFIYRFPSLGVLNRLTNFSLAHSLAFFSAGIAIGIIMLFEVYHNISLGSPKEILMYAVWCILLIVWIIAHSKITSNFYVSIITIVAFVIVIVLFIATNVVITTGFHSFR
ncbi:MAG TPA: cytochrome c biogenesis protein CcsA [Spirochaetota bacterium]|nr:cytochrome c biogenesis protein CcsA [Spirochaetota bacterium]